MREHLPSKGKKMIFSLFGKKIFSIKKLKSLYNTMGLGRGQAVLPFLI